MPLLKIRSVTIALILAIAVLLVPLALTIHDLIRQGNLASWLRLVALLAAIAAVGLALSRQRAVRVLLAERQRLEEERHASDAMFAGILGIAADAVVTVDEKYQIINFNKGAEEIFGWPAKEVIGQSLNHLLPERFRPRHSTFIDEFARSAEPARRMGHRREVAGRRRNGTEFPAEASISKLELPGGRRVFTAVVRDITERRRAQENERFLADTAARLSASLGFEETLQTIAECATPTLGDACVVDVLDGAKFVRHVADSDGVPNEEARGSLRALAERGGLDWESPSPVVDVIRRGRSELVPAVDDAWLEAHEDDPERLTRWRRLGVHSMLVVPLVVGERALGAVTLLAINSRPAYGSDARALAEKFASHASLALENARLYREAKRATEGRDQVLGVVSHDLRNPLSAIAMCGTALRNDPKMQTAEREDLLGTIIQSTEWMNRLIQDLLDVASIEAGRLSLERSREEIGSLLSKALRMFEVEASQRRIALTMRAAADLPIVVVDGSRIVQVLGNLLRNALKFTPDGGQITVGAEVRGGNVVFSVTDNGPGIPIADQSRVFDRYWQSRRTANKRGTGLGLSIAKGIIDAHGGRMWLESTPGQGTTFYFSIPT